MTICPNCGMFVPDGARFCGNCGSYLAAATTPPYSTKEKQPCGIQAIVSLVLGIFSMLYAAPVFWNIIGGKWGIWMLGLLVSCISGAVLGNAGRKDARRRRCSDEIASAGMMLSLTPIVVALVLGIAFLMFFILVWLFASAVNGGFIPLFSVVWSLEPAAL